MRHKLRHLRRVNRHVRRGFRRSFRRRGNLLGLVGLAALGYTLYEKHQREQSRDWTNTDRENAESQDWTL